MKSGVIRAMIEEYQIHARHKCVVWGMVTASTKQIYGKQLLEMALRCPDRNMAESLSAMGLRLIEEANKIEPISDPKRRRPRRIQGM